MATLDHVQAELVKLASNTPIEKRPEFVVKRFPRSCVEYLSTGLGDSDCGGELNRLSKHVAQCKACSAVYIMKVAVPDRELSNVPRYA